ncbi:hypothetical protein [Kitasatospora sp. NBC_00315]|uniref:hypothetical protein n=1 Tax=Kitasatospora sp. NBC_00315 TaxID=2975963 RepID=UPI0032502CC0
MANADSQAAMTPPDEFPATTIGRPMTRSMNRTRSLPKLSRVYRPGVHVRTPLAAQVHRVDLEVLRERRHRPLVTPPRLGLARDQQQRGPARTADDAVVHPHLAEVGGVLAEGVRHEDLEALLGLKVLHHRSPLRPDGSARNLRDPQGPSASARLTRGETPIKEPAIHGSAIHG